MAYCIWKQFKLKVSPEDIFRAFARQKNCFFLDSSLKRSSLGRYSFLGCNPFRVLESKNSDPLPGLRKLLNEYKIAKSKIPFSGGAIGYLSYDLGLFLEKKIKIRAKSDSGIPDCFIGFYNSAVVIDHWKNRIYIGALGLPEKKSNLERLLARENYQKIISLLSDIEQEAYPPGQTANAELKSNFSKIEYIKAVKKVKNYIRAGDIYQANLSQQFITKSNLSAVDFYNRLRSISPSCFSSYFDCGDFQILSSSPERFLKLESGIVTTHPMKGTRPRGGNRDEDRSLRGDLAASPKDKAELMMVVDLERNDLGRVCDYKSIKVESLREIEKYSTVFQAIARIKGKLFKNKDRIDLLRACFPGGSITGAPKIRAMEIIEELEPHRRGVYTGSFGYFGFSGNMDLSILIRTILRQGNKLSFGVGGGIVADSNPIDEYKETLVKAQGMIRAIQMAPSRVLPAETPRPSSLTLRAGKGFVSAVTRDGDGIFETMRVYHGKIVYLDAHIKRMRESAKILDIECLSEQKIKKIIADAIKKSQIKDMYLRLTLVAPGPEIIVGTKEYKPYPRAKYDKGFKVSVALQRQDEDSIFSRVKTTKRDFYDSSLVLAQSKGFEEAIILNKRGEITEGSRSNIFLVKNNELFTPGVSCGCLPGITRQVIFDLAKENNIKCSQDRLTIKDLDNCDEAFLTNSLMGVMPINKKCAKITKLLIKQYNCLLK